MAHSKQAQKRIRTSEKARVTNKVVRSSTRSAVKKAGKTAAPADQSAQKTEPTLPSLFDDAPELYSFRNDVP